MLVACLKAVRACSVLETEPRLHSRRQAASNKGRWLQIIRTNISFKADVHSICSTHIRLLHSSMNKIRDKYKPFTTHWSLYVPHSGHYMYHQFNIQRFYVLPTECIYVFCVDLRTNKPLFPYTALTDWFC